MHWNQGDSLNFDSKWYIPQGELWCDKNFENEVDFLTQVETSSVSSREEVKRIFTKQGPILDFKKSQTQEGETQVVLVDGSVVRSCIDPWFVMGGHHYVYEYVPENEVWIDEKLEKQDIPLITLHEVTERNLMKHEHKGYDVAHEYAVAVEREARRKAGGSYPGDDAYPYSGLSELIQTFYATGTR
jgi:hypothetical protein